MKKPIITYVNLAKTPLGISLPRMVKAHQKFLNTVFQPVWGLTAHLRITQLPPNDTWLMLFVDDAEEADSLGFHDLTKDGRPIAKIFVKETKKQGEPLSVNTCHELCEMLVDPGGQMWAFNENDDLYYAYEVCDAVEGDKYIMVNGVPHCNFVYPAFFESWSKLDRKFDHLGEIRRPFETGPDGYQTVTRGRRVHEIFGSQEKRLRFEQEDRRGHRSEERKWTLAHAESDRN